MIHVQVETMIGKSEGNDSLTFESIYVKYLIQLSVTFTGSWTI